jgi:hypothetical protein
MAALLCMAAIATAAQASGEFSTGSYPAVIKGTPTSPTNFRLGGTIKEGKCEYATYSGVSTESSSTLKVAPAYAGCTLGDWEVTMKPNGCTLGWNLNELSGGKGEGPETVSCPAGKEFEILAEKGNQLVCAYGISSQGAGGSIGYVGAGSGSEARLELATNVSPTATVKAGGVLLCNGSVGQSVSLNFSGGIKAQAFNEEEKSVGLTMGTATLTGKFNTGTGQYPTVVSLSRSGSYTLLKAGVREITCGEEAVSVPLGAAAKSISMAPSYASCAAGGGLTATVTTTGCSYNLSVQSSSGSASTENLGVACGAGELLIGVYNGSEKVCEYGEPSQTIEGISGTSSGSGASAYVELGLKELTVPTVNVKYAKSKLICGNTTGTLVAGKTNGTLLAKASSFGLRVL